MGKYNRRGRHFCYMCENDNNIRERQLFHYQSLDIIVAVGDAAAALAHGRQLAAMLPAVGPRSVVQGVAYGIVGDGLPIERRQQVRPIGVAVGVGAACCPDVADKRRPRPLLAWTRTYVTSRFPEPLNGLSSPSPSAA